MNYTTLFLGPAIALALSIGLLMLGAIFDRAGHRNVIPQRPKTKLSWAVRDSRLSRKIYMNSSNCPKPVSFDRAM
jgi:hypothetical protein